MTRRGMLLGLGSLASVAAALTLGGAPNTARAAPQPVVHRDFVVVIDPGHGGTNQGCHAHGDAALEKDVTLDVSMQLAARLRELMPHAEVVLTRESDATMTLGERVKFANDVGGDLFLSIHANASPESNQTGFESFILDVKASSMEAARVAARENDEGFREPAPRDDVASMVRELSMRAHHDRAARFAAAIQKHQAERFPERPDRGVRQAPFDVLMGVRMPAVLTEIGFLDHFDEGAMLRDEQHRERIVDGLAEAVVEYYGQVERSA